MNIKKNILVLFFLLLTNKLYSMTGEEIAEKFEISAADKVIVIWEKIFEKKKYRKIFPRSKRPLYLEAFKQLSPEDIEKIKIYLIEHAADTDKPKIVGDI